jgi:hypothetical protein
VLHSASHAATWRFDCPFSLSPYFCNCREFCRLQAKVNSIPIAPRPPQTPAASFKRLYRKRARAACFRFPLRRMRASDRALTLIGSWEANCNWWTLGRISVVEMSACTGRISSATIRLFERLPLRLHGFLPCFPLFLGYLLVRLPGLARIFCDTGTLSFSRYRPGNTQGD